VASLARAPRRPQVEVRVDDRRGEPEALAVDHAMLVRREVRAELRDDARVDPDIQKRVDPLGRVDYARAADDEILVACLSEQHHAAPISCRAAAWTPAGPWVSRS